MPYEYIPQCGDIILLNFEQEISSKHMGRTPALVISPKEYNGKTGMAIICFISEHIKNYPFEVKITENPKISGVILPDRIKTINWRPGNIEFLIKLSPEVLKKVIIKLKILL